MARETFDSALALTVSFEGGFSDHPRDPGGATKYGITRAVLEDWRGTVVTRADVMALRRAEAAAIYRRLYWELVGGDDLPPGVDAAMFDFAVNSGIDRASRTLQRIIGVVPDGIIGIDTVRVVRTADSSEVIRSLCRHRLGFLGRLKIYPVFGRGWRRRVMAVEQFALAQAAEARPRSAIVQLRQETPMELTKTLLESRTVWSNLVGLAALLAKAIGLDMGDVDQNTLVDAVLTVISGAGFIASTVFRIKATRQIA